VVRSRRLAPTTGQDTHQCHALNHESGT
jgi:hypothetical protein